MRPVDCRMSAWHPTPLRSCGALGTALAAALLIVLASSSGSAKALQVIEARDGASVEAILSIHEPTRIRIEGAPITDVFGSIHGSGCMATQPVATIQAPGLTASTSPAVSTGGLSSAPALSPSPSPSAPLINPGAEIVIECDREKGEIYVRPIGEGKKPINLFIASARGTYTLLLRRADTPADTIVIRDKAALQRRVDTPSSQLMPGMAASHVRGLKALLVAMASDRMPTDIQMEEVDEPVTLWREALFTLQRTYRGRGLIGERYRLQNVSDALLVLAEQEFDRPGDATASVAAVAIEHHNLRPGEGTLVYVIRREVQP